MVEAGVKIKVIQDALGHKDIQTTMNIYADVTRELKKSEFEGLDGFFKKNREEQQDEWFHCQNNEALRLTPNLHHFERFLWKVMKSYEKLR